MDERCKQYHSALSRCAELLDNMKDGDPITEAPDFLAAKLKELQTPVPRVGGNTIRTAIEKALKDKHIEDGTTSAFNNVVGEIEREVAAYLASQSQAAQPSIEGLKRYHHNEYSKEIHADPIGEYVQFDDVIAHLAGQSQATRAAPDKLENLTRYMFTFEGMEVDNACGRYYLADDVDSFVEKRLAPTAQEVTQQAAPTELRDALQFIHDTFKHDLDAGFKTKDKEFAVSIAAEALRTQQAAKAETAEQAEGVQANRNSALRAEPAGQQGAVFRGTIDAGEYNRETGMMRVTVKLPFKGLPEALLTINAAAFIAPADESEATRCRAEGGDTSKEIDSDLAPTTSTVSAPEEVRDAAPVISSYDLEKVKSLKYKFVDELIHSGIQYRTCGTISATLNQIIDDSEKVASAALRTTSGKGEAA